MFKLLLLIVSIFILDLSADIKDSIVKIYTVSKVPNYSIPWNSSLRRSHGSGTIINGNRILTNAHVVANQTFIEVKRYGKTRRYEAEVEFISHQVDLALLKVKNQVFFEGADSLELGNLPQTQQKVSVYGFPMGGNALSVSSGIVSRIEHTRYAHSQERFLSIQIDAAVNPGNSGGPAISDGKIVGVVMQQIRKSQNIGYLVPSNIVKHFLVDINDGKYNGFGDLGIATQKMENKALRDVYKMSDKETGVMLIDISPKSSAFGILKVGDVLISIDNHNINNDGTVEFMPEQYTSYNYYIDQKQLGNSVRFKVLRDGYKKDIDVSVLNIADDNLLVDTLEHDVMPRYFIFGGYVFTPLTRNLLATSRSTLLSLREASSEWASDKREEVVVLLKVLADQSNRGDHMFSLWMIDQVNSKTFKNFYEFKKLIQNTDKQYIILQNNDGVKVAIDKAKAMEVENKILKRYSIRSSSSEL